MSETKFTPGPWEADCRLGVFVIRPEGDSLRCLSGASNDSIVYQEGRGMPNSNYRYLTEEQEANARLMAAAPEMYEALSEAIHNSCIKIGCHAYNNGECMNGPSLCCVQKWLAALKKARGEA
ncbi:MAG: hypothetical protein AB7F32_05000 [Victivallaceae bacterium]